MANFVFGDVDEIMCSHPDLGDLRFSPKANESGTRDKGGIRSNDDASQLTSSGQNMIQLNRVKWSFEVPIAVESNGKTEDELNSLAKSPLDGVWTISYLSGLISKGTGRPVGDIQSDSNTGLLTLKLSGGGELETL